MVLHVFSIVKCKTFLIGACAAKDHESCYGYPMHACEEDWLIKNCKRKCGLCQGEIKLLLFVFQY